MKTCIVCGEKAEKVVQCVHNPEIMVSFCSKHMSKCENCESEYGCKC